MCERRKQSVQASQKLQAIHDDLSVLIEDNSRPVLQHQHLVVPVDFRKMFNFLLSDLTSLFQSLSVAESSQAYQHGGLLFKKKITLSRQYMGRN